MSSGGHFIKELNAEILDGDSAKSLQNIHRRCEAYLYCSCFKWRDLTVIFTHFELCLLKLINITSSLIKGNHDRGCMDIWSN